MTTYPEYTVSTLPGQYNLLALAEKHPDRYPYLLESTAQTLNDKANISRYDILMAYPQQQLKKTWQGELILDDKILPDKNFLDTLDSLYSANAYNCTLTLPFVGGWFLYLGYELASEIEPGLGLPETEQNLPVAMAVRIPVGVIYDRANQETHVVAEKNFEHTISDVVSDLQSSHDENNVTPAHAPISVTEEDPNKYLDGVKKVLDYITEGDVFQVNLSREWSFEYDKPSNGFDIYRRLRKTNPAPFSAYVKIDKNVVILSSSPERLVRVRNRKIETRPIAGTRPRSESEQDDNQLQSELIANLKERAEHVMLIDLERNDLGRVCQPGSINVDEMMIIESYAHVHHIVSNISGYLRDNVNPGDVIAAVFPGGTITGCPKVRCMEIIQELEKTARGAYTGSIGYLNHNGDMDLNILIRSIVIDHKTGRLRAGAGLVTDSIPDKELEETRSKAKGLLLALNTR